MKAIMIHQGDSVEPIPVRPNLKDESEKLSGDWKCFFSIIDARGNEVLASKEVTTKSEDELSFIVMLSPDNTRSLAVAEDFALYYLVVQVSNETLLPVYSKERHFIMQVRRGAIA